MRMQAPQQVGEECSHFLRFAAEGGIQVEMQLSVVVIPGPPADWSLTFPDKPGRPAGAVICGQPFSLEVEALDMYRNRCSSFCATPGAHSTSCAHLHTLLLALLHRLKTYKGMLRRPHAPFTCNLCLARLLCRLFWHASSCQARALPGYTEI